MGRHLATSYSELQQLRKQVEEAERALGDCSQPVILGGSPAGPFRTSLLLFKSYPIVISWRGLRNHSITRPAGLLPTLQR